jgi:hypothetical protein
MPLAVDLGDIHCTLPWPFSIFRRPRGRGGSSSSGKPKGGCPTRASCSSFRNLRQSCPHKVDSMGNRRWNCSHRSRVGGAPWKTLADLTTSTASSYVAVSAGRGGPWLSPVTWSSSSSSLLRLRRAEDDRSSTGHFSPESFSDKRGSAVRRVRGRQVSKIIGDGPVSLGFPVGDGPVSRGEAPLPVGDGLVPFPVGDGPVSRRLR